MILLPYCKEVKHTKFLMTKGFIEAKNYKLSALTLVKMCGFLKLLYQASIGLKEQTEMYYYKINTKQINVCSIMFKATNNGQSSFQSKSILQKLYKLVRNVNTYIKVILSSLEVSTNERCSGERLSRCLSSRVSHTLGTGRLCEAV